MTSYEAIYKRALAQITDPLLAHLPEEDLEIMLHDWLMDAITEPVVGKYDFSDRDEELKQFKNIPLAELLQWATINGAKALGIDDKYGSIEPGKRSGIVCLTGVDLENFALTPSAKAKRVL